MARLIDADAYEHAVQGNPYVSDSMKTYVRCSIQSQPTIDAEPVRHGKWTHDGGYFKNRWICSECGYKWFSTKESGKFCPNCGADMRGEEE